MSGKVRQARDRTSGYATGDAFPQKGILRDIVFPFFVLNLQRFNPYLSRLDEKEQCSPPTCELKPT